MNSFFPESRIWKAALDNFSQSVYGEQQRVSASFRYGEYISEILSHFGSVG